jgi:hypothetical protein
MREQMKELQTALPQEARQVIDTSIDELLKRGSEQFWVDTRVTIVFMEQKLLRYLEAVEHALIRKLEQIRKEKTLGGMTPESLVAEAIRGAKGRKLDPHVSVPVPDWVQFVYCNSFGAPAQLRPLRERVTLAGFGLSDRTYALALVRADGTLEPLKDGGRAVVIGSDYHLTVDLKWLEPHVRPGHHKLRIDVDGKKLSEVLLTFGAPPSSPTPKREIIKVELGSQSFVPPHVGGGTDFNGHGPHVNVVAELCVGQSPTGQDVLQTRLFMDAVEARNCPHPVHASGWSPWKTAYIAPPGVRILRIVSATSSTAEYTDSNHDDDKLALPAGELVCEFVCVGDTKGPEAGTRTGVTAYFNFGSIEIEHPVR